MMAFSGTREDRLRARPFIGWDSEGYDYFIADSFTDQPGYGVEKGPQRTMLFGCCIEGRHEYITGMDLGTEEMLDLILEVEKANPDAFHVGFAFEYDVNQILKDLPWRVLAILKEYGKVRWKKYHIEHVPHKIFSVSRDGVSATIYDVFGFFHCKYTTAIEKFDVGTKLVREIIERGKKRRGHFTWADIGEVIEYWKAEISLFGPLMDVVRDVCYSAGYFIDAWHGPGALASKVLRNNEVRKIMSRGNRAKKPKGLGAAIKGAYCGGRFQAWQCGEYEGDVYTLDKNSAYVQAVALLPRLDNGKWVRGEPGQISGPDDIARFGLYYIEFDAYSKDRNSFNLRAGIPQPPYPLFHRAGNGMLSWPDRVSGWYWSPEARLVAGNPHARFTQSIVYQDDGSYPFKWVNDIYHARLVLKRRGDPAEKAIKWMLASLYGAFARRVGWDRVNRLAPASHELAWAGFITSHCRAAIYDVAAYAYKTGGLISVDTDGVTSTTPFPEDIVPEGFGDGLGQWKQDHYSGILLWQNGIYWLRNQEGEWDEAKSRGVPKGRISREDADEALAMASFSPPYEPATLTACKHKYIGYRACLGGHRFTAWRKWVDETTNIAFGGQGKGTHLPPFCYKCKGGGKMRAWGKMHTVSPMFPRGWTVESSPHKIPWEEPAPFEIIGEIGNDIFATADDIYARGTMEDRL